MRADNEGHVAVRKVSPSFMNVRVSRIHSRKGMTHNTASQAEHTSLSYHRPSTRMTRVHTSGVAGLDAVDVGVALRHALPPAPLQAARHPLPPPVLLLLQQPLHQLQTQLLSTRRTDMVSLRQSNISWIGEHAILMSFPFMVMVMLR